MTRTLRLACLCALMFAPIQTGAQDATYDEPEIIAAEAVAAKSLPLFFKCAFDSTGRGLDGALLLIEVPADSGSRPTEPVWVFSISLLRADSLTGQVSDEPLHISELHQGDKLTFRRDQIRDWAFGVANFPEYRKYGDFTGRAIAPLVDARTARIIYEELQSETIPPDWRGGC